MKKNKTPLIALIALLAVVVIASAVYIIGSPDDLPRAAADNTNANIVAGGDFVQGKGIAFYLSEGDIYSIFEGESEKIIGDASGPLFFTNGGVAYVKNSALYMAQADGSLETLIVSNIKNPVIIGAWVYYIKNGEIVKMRMSDKKMFDLGLKCSGKFYVTASRVFYLGEDGFLYTANTNGSENALVTSYPMTNFALCGNHIAFIGSSKILSVFPIAEPSVKADIAETDMFNYVSGKIIYKTSEGLSAYSLSDASKTPLTSTTSAINGIYTGDDGIYYFNDKGDLEKISIS